MSNLYMAFLFTLIAGLSTGIGSLIAFLAKKTNKKFLSISLGFSAGVMIYVSMIEIFASAQDTLTAALGQKLGSWVTVISFFGGMFLITLIDKFIPSEENPHDIKLMDNVEDSEKIIEENKHKETSKLMRTGVFTALAIAIHNFP